MLPLILFFFLSFSTVVPLRRAMSMSVSPLRTVADFELSFLLLLLFRPLLLVFDDLLLEERLLCELDLLLCDVVVLDSLSADDERLARRRAATLRLSSLSFTSTLLRRVISSSAL